MCGPEIVNDEHLAGPQEHLLFDCSQWKATLIEEGSLMLKGIELHSAEMSGRVERDQLMPSSSDFDDPAQNALYRPVECRGLTKSLGNDPPVSPGLVSQQPSERKKPRDSTGSILLCASEQCREPSNVNRCFSSEWHTEVDVQSLKWSLARFWWRHGEFANHLELRHPIAQRIGQAGLSEHCKGKVPCEPAVRPSARYAGESLTHQVLSDLWDQLSLRQVENRFRDIAFAHSTVVCCPGQTEASIPRTTASRSPGNLASSSVRRSVISFRCPS
jgi:hypothetical protein